MIGLWNGDQTQEETYRKTRSGMTTICSKNTILIIQKLNRGGRYGTDVYKRQILRNQPDPAFLSYLESYHIQLPYIFSISDTQYKGPISEQILREPNILDYLLGLSNNDSIDVYKRQSTYLAIRLIISSAFPSR